MHKTSPDPLAAAPASGATGSGGPAAGDPSAAAGATGGQQRAAVAPVPETISAAENPAPALPADSPLEAQGRRTLSTAFVRVGPDGGLTVELRDGRVLVLRDVVMGPKKYCGVQVGGTAGSKYCGTYGEVAAARPGGTPSLQQPDRAVSKPLAEPK